MPTDTKWKTDKILESTWIAPLKSSEIAACFLELVDFIRTKQHIVHVIFDIKDAGNIPTQAPLDFVKSQMARQANMGMIAVVGMNTTAQILAQMASRMSGQTILFFVDEDLAIEYLETQ